MDKIICIILIKLRWAYFHLHPNYIKFYVTKEKSHFQNIKTGKLHSDLVFNDLVVKEGASNGE